MQRRTYTFLLRKNGTLRCISTVLWQQLLQRQQALSGPESSQLTVGEIHIDNQVIQRVCLWHISVDVQGFIVRRHCQPLPCPALSASLDELFQAGGVGFEQVLVDFIDELIADDAGQCPLPPLQADDDERYIDQLLASR